MSELHDGTEIAGPAALDQQAGDSLRNGAADLGAEYDGDLDALAAAALLPPRQDSRAATWGDSPVYDDEGDTEAGYDGGPEALMEGDDLPPRQDSRAATWSDDPEYYEADPGAEYDGDLDAVAGGRLPPRQDSRAATWGEDPVYDDEADPGAEYDGDPEVLAADGRALDSGRSDKDEDRAVLDEVPSATGELASGPAEVTGQEYDRLAALQSSSAGVPADMGSEAEGGSGGRPGEVAQAAQADDAHVNSDGAPGVGLEELKAEYEASLEELKAELQALKDSRRAGPDVQPRIGRDADQPRLDGHELSPDQKNPKEARPEGDRPGPWSNAKYALYGAVGTTVGMALLDQFAPSLSRVVEDIVVGGPTVIGALVPTLREGWKRKHDSTPDKS